MTMKPRKPPSGREIELLKAAVEQNLNLRMPRDYIEFVSQNDGYSGLIGRSYLQLFTCDTLIENNSGYQGGTPAEKLLIFATDGGGELFVIDARHETERYIMVNSVGWEIDNPITLGQSFDEFLRAIRDGQQWSASPGSESAVA